MPGPRNVPPKSASNGKSKKQTKGVQKSRAKASKAKVSATNLTSLAQLAADQATLHRKAAKTAENYSGHIRRGREFLANFVSEEQDAETAWIAREGPRMSGDGEEEAVHGQNSSSLGQEDPEFVRAFDGAPLKCTPVAIKLFLAKKCFQEEHGESTAVAIHAAFKDLYKQLDGDTYRGRWHYDESKQRWSGNPVDSAEVETVMDVIKNKFGAEGERHHSKAMSKDDMDQLLVQSRLECPQGFPVTDHASLMLKAMHLRFNAFSTTGFNVWTRNNEAVNLKVKDFNFAPGDRRGGTPYDPPHFKVRLHNRKNWQNKAKNGEQLQGHSYSIYSQPKTPSIDMYSHMLDWLDFYETTLLKRHLQPEDYIFPTISTNGTVQPHVLMTAAIVQKDINIRATLAGLSGAGCYTTHCFRRGGAQYRFMFAPIGERWTLARIRWWGGWADGEHRDTLIKYLLNELYYYEEDHSDALCPIDRQANQSHVGEAAEMRPMTAAEGRQMFAAQREMYSELIQQVYRAGMQSVSNFVMSASGEPQATMFPPCSTAQPSLPISTTLIHPSPAVPSSFTSQPTLPAAVAENLLAISSAPRLPLSASAPASNRRLPPSFMTGFSHSVTPPVTNYASVPVTPRALPCSSRIIPKVPRGEHGWRTVVSDWESGDESRSLPVPLKDWDPEWYSGEAGRTLGTLYNNRRLIATEFITHCKRDESIFLSKYPEHRNGITDLLYAIRLVDQSRPGGCKSRQTRK